MKYTTSSISCNAAVVIKSQNSAWYVNINESRNYDLGNILFAKVTMEVEAGMLLRNNAVLKHTVLAHDQSPSVQQGFIAHTKTLFIAFQEADNPFDESSSEVVIADTREVMTDNAPQYRECTRRRAEAPAQQSHSTR